MNATVLPGAGRAVEKHPPALPILFFTEMWERFSYYGMRALLVLYLVNALDYDARRCTRSSTASTRAWST